jgi:hypothetical protein
MPYLALAYLVLLAHLAFILFVLLGGLWALKQPRVAWVHLPVAIWGALSEFLSLPCPLTPLEKHFLRLAGETPYQGDFIAHYLFGLIYPAGLTPAIQILLGILVVVLNAAIYARLLLRRR